MKKINNLKEYVTNLVKNIFKGKNGEVVSVKGVHLGYTNESFIVTFSNKKKYQVRLPHCGNLINRNNEYRMIQILNIKYFDYFDPKSGIAVKKWIPGRTPWILPFWKWSKVDELFSCIRKIHHTSLANTNHKFQKIVFNAYNENLFRLKLQYQTKFLALLDTYRDDVCVLNHSDINPQNIIKDNNGRIHLIDFEWCGLAPDYWDYANFIRETRINWYTKINWNKYIDNFNMQKLKDYIYICSVFAYLWTWMMPQTSKIKKYRAKVLRQVQHYARGVIRNEER